MGRKHKSYKKRKNTNNDNDYHNERKNKWHINATYNRLMKEYYVGQKIEEDEAGYEAFWTIFKESLPSTFRIDSRGKYASILKQKLSGELQKGYPIILTDEEKAKGSHLMEDVINPPSPITWYPDNNAWRLGCNKMMIRKVEGLKELKDFLLTNTESGTIVRQEEASMIPPYFLGVERHHKVLDMCAAPGSKTTQLIEALHRDDHKHKFEVPTGMVVANDVNSQRAYMLMHRIKPQLTPNVMITAHDATSFPNPVNINYDHSKGIPRLRHGYFDRILADVPCSGDGTVRKSPDILRNFDIKNGQMLHEVQLKIAQRGIDLLKIGGLMVYSTCSLNPIENEAVVAQLLRQNNGSVELVDTSKMIPLLKRRPGLETWKCAIQLRHKKGNSNDEKKNPEVKEDLNQEKQNEEKIAEGKVLDTEVDGSDPNSYIKWFENIEEYDTYMKEFAVLKQRVPTTGWPPKAEEAKTFNLKRCMRIMPQDNNTSGFFVCLLKKTGESVSYTESKSAVKNANESSKDATTAVTTTIANATNTTITTTHSTDNKTDNEKLKKKDNDPNLLSRNDDLLVLPSYQFDSIKNMCQFENSISSSQIFYRAGDGQQMDTKAKKKRRIEQQKSIEAGESVPQNVYYVSKEISNEIILKNTFQRMHICGAGLPLFKRNSRRKSDKNGDMYRISQDGIRFALPHLKGHIISNKMSLSDLTFIIAFALHETNDPIMKAVGVKYPGPPIGILSKSLQDHIKTLPHRGGLILELDKDAQSSYIELFGQCLALTVWIGSQALSPLIGKAELTLLKKNLIYSGFLSDKDFELEANPDELRKKHLPDDYISTIMTKVEEDKAKN